MAKNSAASMTEGPLLGKIIRYTIPIICTGLLQLLFNAADLVVVGRYCGSVSVAAVGATGSITMLIVNLFIGLSVGAGVTVAQAIGAKDPESIHTTVHTAIPTALLSGVTLTVLGLLLSEPLLRAMGTPDDVIGLSTTYMRLYFCGMTFSMLYNYGAAILRAAGNTRGPLVYLTISGVVNVVLNVFFVVALKLDVAGVALATAISQALSAVLVSLALMRRTDACRLDFRQMRFARAPLKKILLIGLPAGLQGSLFSISNVLIQSSINSFGSVLMSGNAAAGNIEGFVYVGMNAFHQTALNFTGQNVGAGKYDRVSRIYTICLVCVTGVGLLLGLLAYTFARPLLSIYITDSAEAIRYGVIRMLYLCVPYFLCGLMDVSTGAIRGMGVSLAPMIISVLGICGFRILWIYTIFQIPAYHTPAWLYLSYPISWAITFAAQFIVFRSIVAKRRRAMEARDI